ncbi:uncharacterized protein LOC134505888 [Candoia aspera]|uniref:uncharacterized protein LOC134505888 n=1 Tax=Candoia aspera TaxID=51853 RepID=UPI002FD85404
MKMWRMFWFSALVGLGWFFPGLESQMVLTQPSSMSASPGSTLRIPCTMNSGYTINSERARWYQQKPGGIPRFLYHYYTSTDQGRGTGVPERFSVSADPSQNVWNLVISGVQVEDDADYYCSSWDYKLTGKITQFSNMAWILLVFIILSFFGASIQQLQSLKDPESVALGGIITMSCSYGGGTITDNNYPFWIQQKPEEIPRLLIYSTSSRPSGIPARFTGSRSGNTMSLTITGSLVEDDATYYCAVWTGSGCTVLDLDREVRQKPLQETSYFDQSGLLLHEGDYK